jgi:prepilin-type N-terminal cleavage/methylation domain-containing protein
MRIRPNLTCQTLASATDRGFTLVELLLAVTIGSVLLTTVASGLQLFSQELEHVRDEPDLRLEEAALLATGKIQDAWWVEANSASDISLADPSGDETRLRLSGTDLLLTRPSGAEGVLLSGVASLGFGTETTQRLRDDTVTTATGPWFSRPAPFGPDVELILKEDDELCFAFHMSDDAPDSVDTVSGVNEERLDGALEQIVLKASFLDGSLKEFCHLHATEPHNSEHPGYEGHQLFVSLHEARAPDDARPYGPALASIVVGLDDLPHASFVWWDTTENEQAYPPDAENADYTPDQCIDEDGDGECDHNGKNKHKNPLDVPGGVAWGWWDNHPDVDLIISAPSVDVPIDLSQFGSAIERGKAYCLAVSVKGWDEFRVSGVAQMSSASSGTALLTGGGSHVPLPVVFPMSLEGDQTCTQTVEVQAISTVTLDIQMTDGRNLSTSASLLSQTAVPDPWRGVVPDQIGDVGP